MGAGGGVKEWADLDDVVQGSVGLAVSAVGEPVPVGTPGADRDGRCAAQGRTRPNEAERGRTTPRSGSGLPPALISGWLR